MEDERGPGLDLLLCFVCGSRPVRGCRFSFVSVYFIIKVFECSPVPVSFFPSYELCYKYIIQTFSYVIKSV